MPRINREERIKYGREHYRENTEVIKKREMERYHSHHEEIRARRNESYRRNKGDRAGQQRRMYARKRLLVIQHYGGKCVCCGEQESLFLQLDHVNNDGGTHRKEIGHSSHRLHLWAIRNNYPDTLQVLCANCNQGKERNGGICPHKKNMGLLCQETTP